jgi:hypothetical protein
MHSLVAMEAYSGILTALKVDLVLCSTHHVKRLVWLTIFAMSHQAILIPTEQALGSSMKI